jgi:hypothetical protein
MIVCTPMKAKISESACRKNKEVCKVAIIQILEGLGPFSLSPVELDRLFYCGQCPRFTRWDDISYTRNRKHYNPDALVGGEERIGTLAGEIRCAADVIEVVRAAIRKNFLRIEEMDLDRGDPEIQKIRRRKRERRWREEGKIKVALGNWVQNSPEEEEEEDHAN